MARISFVFAAAAAVALVLLSSCSTAVRTDHTARLAGTWRVHGLTSTIVVGGQSIPVATAAEVVIADLEDANKGTFVLTVTQTTPAGMEISTTGSGSVIAETPTAMMVTLDTITGPDIPEQVTAVQGVQQTLNYELTAQTLKVSGPILMALGVTSAAMPEVTFTRL